MSGKNGYVMIPVKLDTKTEVDATCPKSQSYDEFIWDMLVIYRKIKSETKGNSYGKSAKNHQAD